MTQPWLGWRLLLAWSLCLFVSPAWGKDVSPGRVRAIELEQRDLGDNVDQYEVYRERLLEIVSTASTSEEAMDALMVLARWARYRDHDEAALVHLQQLSHDYTDDPALAIRLRGLSHLGADFVAPAFTYLMEVSTLVETRDNALLELANSFGYQRDGREEAETLYEKAAGSTLESVRESARAKLLAMRNLQVGQLAPEVQGTDLSGQLLRVSDFRGKVVILDFWGTWCGPCVKDLPKLAELCAQYGRGDLQIIGINTDPVRDKLDAFLSQHEDYDWPQILDGSTTGPICTTWDVEGFPTYVVLDRRGVIRSKGGSSLTSIVKELVAEQP